MRKFTDGKLHVYKHGLFWNVWYPNDGIWKDRTLVCTSWRQALSYAFLYVSRRKKLAAGWN